MITAKKALELSNAFQTTEDVLKSIHEAILKKTKTGQRSVGYMKKDISDDVLEVLKYNGYTIEDALNESAIGDDELLPVVLIKW
jgi:hypothetical protein